MPIVRASEGHLYEAHGARFTSYAATARGSKRLCAWRLELPPQSHGVAHRPSEEEIVLVLEGAINCSLDGVEIELDPGDVVVVGAGSELRVDTGAVCASAWVTTTSGLEAELSDGSRFAPPWAR